MAAPKGNKNGLGHGRPNWHDRPQIALDIIEWAKKEDSINLCKFCALYVPPIPPNKITLWAKEDDYFRQALDTAKAFLGFRREEWLSKELLHVKSYDLNASTYDHFLKDEKRQQAEFEASLKAKEDQQVSEGLMSVFDKHMSQLKEMQNQTSALKSSDSTCNKQQKS